MIKAQIKQLKQLEKARYFPQRSSIIPNNGVAFTVFMWLLSRSIVILAMLVVAPLIPAPPGEIQPSFGWDIFWAWDSEHYQNIATSGYEYANDGEEHNIAFFPLFPLLIRGLMFLGLPFEPAGFLVNNLAFLGTLIILYLWIEERNDRKAAQWAVAILAWCPLSIFGTVIYSEGLFLFFSTAAMRAFDRRQYLQLALFGALATASRPTGLVFIPALLVAAWREKRPLVAYLASLATSLGLLSYSLFCWIKFHDPIAFITVQKAWRPSFGFDWFGWWRMLLKITIGTTNFPFTGSYPISHLLQFTLICSLAYLLWHFRSQLSSAQFDYSFGFLGLYLWLLGGDPFTNVAMVLGGAYALWNERNSLSSIALIFGLSAIGLLIISGGTMSLNRLTYGIISVSLAFGILFSRHPRWGYCTIAAFTIFLVSFSIRFAQNLWVA